MKVFGHLLTWRFCWAVVCVLTFSALIVSLFYFSRTNQSHSGSNPSGNVKEASDGQDTIHVAVMACGKRLDDVVVMAKSLALTTTSPVVLHVFMDKQLQPLFKMAMSVWPDSMRENFECIVRDPFLPTRAVGGIPNDFWARFFWNCAYITLFLPEALPELDRVIYVDVDTVFLSPVEGLWDQAARFNAQQYFGITLESNQERGNFYKNFKVHPIYGKMGLNTGMILFDLKKMNRTQFLVDIKELFIDYRTKLQLLDQGLLNLYFHFHPESVFEMSCVWNFRSEYCSNNTCPDALRDGIRLLHGNRGGFYSGKLSAFRAIHRAFRYVPHKMTTLDQVLAKLKVDLSKPGMADSECGAFPEMYTLQLEHIVENTRNSH